MALPWGRQPEAGCGESALADQISTRGSDCFARGSRIEVRPINFVSRSLSLSPHGRVFSMDVCNLQVMWQVSEEEGESSTKVDIQELVSRFQAIKSNLDSGEAT